MPPYKAEQMIPLAHLATAVMARATRLSIRMRRVDRFRQYP